MNAERAETIEIQEDVVFEPTLAFAEQTCRELGHNPQRVLADNGFTYEVACGRCGKLLE